MQDVWRIQTGSLGANCYVVSGHAGEAIVIDPGDEAARIAARLDAESLGVHAVIATHAHPDHIGAVADLLERYEAPFHLHPADAGLLRRMNFLRFALHSATPTPTPKIEVPLTDGMTLRFGNLEVEVLHTPGHSPGSVCLVIDGELYTGDIFTSGGIGRVDLPGGSRPELLASVSLLRERFSGETVVRPGHGRRILLGDVAETSA